MKDEKLSTLSMQIRETTSPALKMYFLMIYSFATGKHQILLPSHLILCSVVPRQTNSFGGRARLSKSWLTGSGSKSKSPFVSFKALRVK